MRSTLKLTSALLAILLAGISSSWGQARYDDKPLTHRFTFNVGGFLVQNFDTTIRFDSTQVPIGTVINLEDSLDVDAKAQVARLDGAYHFNKRHGVSFGWFAIDRDGNATVTQEIRIGDPDTGEEIVLKVGAQIRSEWNFDVINLLYNYSFLNTWRYELYVGVGLNIRNLQIGLSGDFDPDDGQTREEEVGGSGLIPLPVVSFGGRWQFSKKWSTQWRFQWFALEFGDYRGVVQDNLVVFDYDTFKHVGFGIGLNIYDMNIEANGSDLRGELTENYAGVLGYVKFYF